MGSVAVVKMSASWRTARIWAFPNVSNGDAGEGLRRAVVSIRAASAAFSADNVRGIVRS